MWIFAVLVLLVVDWIVTGLYCGMRKKRDSSKDTASIKMESGLQFSEKKNHLKSEIIKYVEGYVLYKCVLLQYIPSHRIRKFILKHQFKMNVHKKAMIYHGGEFRNPWNITIGEGSSVGDHARIDGRKKVVIGKNVNIGSGVWIWTEQHDYNDPDFACNNKGGMVNVEDRVWISSRVTVLPNVSIGEGSVLAAGAVVTKNCEKFALYGGCPAKRIGSRNKNLTYELAGEYLHFY